MSLLADAMRAARGLEAERRNLDREIRDEVAEARRIQAQLSCSWADALQIASDPPTRA
jgi:hypothetical protein